MVFTGLVTTIADLERIPGLVPAADLTYEFHPAQRTRRYLTEAVLSRTSPLVGVTVRQANFRRRYNAAVVAVHRAGERVATKIGDIRLQPGDTLLLQTRGDFVDVHRNNRDFYLVIQVGGSTARRHDRALPAAILFGLLLVWLSLCSILPSWHPDWRLGNLFTSESFALAAITVACAMLLIRSLTAAEARAAIDIQVLITIAAAIGLGKALESSGAAAALAQSLVDAVASAGLPAPVVPYLLLAAVYLLTMACTEAITNVAVASMMIPIAVNVAVVGGFQPRPFILAITLAASLSFITPVGYQTNLMVMGPGGYRPIDYAKVGAPLGLLMFMTAMIFIPWHWPFR
jgi:di/tricarboxylate transporter